MSNRKAMTIPKSVLVLYNAAQVIINAYVAYKIAEPLGGRVWGIGLKDTPAVRYGVYLHMLCKYLDFTDTLIIVSCSRFARAFFCASGRRASRPPSLSLPLSPTAMLTAASLSRARVFSCCGRRASNSPSCTCGTTRRSCSYGVGWSARGPPPRRTARPRMRTARGSTRLSTSSCTSTVSAHAAPHRTHTHCFSTRTLTAPFSLRAPFFAQTGSPRWESSRRRRSKRR